jgi:hypothetical protein
VKKLLLMVSIPTMSAACHNSGPPEYETLPSITGPDGRKWWELTCETAHECREALAENCPHGYVTADEQNEEDHASGVVVGHFLVADQSRNISLIFRCRDKHDVRKKAREDNGGE